MAIAYDNAASGSNSGSTITISSFAVGSGSDRALFVTTACRDDSVVNSVAFNTSENFTKISAASVGQSTGTSRTSVEIWRLVNPSNTTANVVVTFDSSPFKAHAGVISLSGVHQSTPTDAVATTTGASGDPSHSVTTNNNNSWVLAAIHYRPSTTVSADSPQTLRWSETTTTTGAAGTQLKATAGSTTASFTMGTSNPWVESLVEIREAAGATTTTKTTTGKARIKKTDVQQTQTGKARIKKADVQQTQTGKARLKKVDVQKTQTGTARLKRVDVQQTITGVANLQTAGQQTITGKARIKVADVQQTQTGTARISLTTSQTQTGVSRLANVAVTKTITGTGRLKKVDVQQTQTGVAKISGSTTKTITGKARLANAIIYDNSASVGGNTSTLTLSSFEVGVGNDKGLFVGVSIRDDSTVSSVTFNTSESFTQIASVGQSTGTARTSVEIWALTDPTSTTADIVVTFNTAPFHAKVGGLSLFGVHQTDMTPTTATATGGSGNPSVNITTANNGSWVLDVLHYRPSTTATATSPQIERWVLTPTTTGAGSTKLVETAGSTSMGWTMGTSNPWAQAAIEIRGSEAAVGTTTDQTITGKANIKATLTQTQTGVANIDSPTKQKNITGAARILKLGIPTVVITEQTTSVAITEEIASVTITEQSTSLTIQENP